MQKKNLYHYTKMKNSQNTLKFICSVFCTSQVSLYDINYDKILNR